MLSFTPHCHHIKRQYSAYKIKQQAIELYQKLNKHFNVDYDDAGSIGKRYRRHDEIGTPYCITFDFDSLEDKYSYRKGQNTMEQVRIKIDDLVTFIDEKTSFFRCFPHFLSVFCLQSEFFGGVFEYQRKNTSNSKIEHL